MSSTGKEFRIGFYVLKSGSKLSELTLVSERVSIFS